MQSLPCSDWISPVTGRETDRERERESKQSTEDAGKCSRYSVATAVPPSQGTRWELQSLQRSACIPHSDRERDIYDHNLNQWAKNRSKFQFFPSFIVENGPEKPPHQVWGFFWVIFDYTTGKDWNFDLFLAHWLRLWPYIYIYRYAGELVLVPRFSLQELETVPPQEFGTVPPLGGPFSHYKNRGFWGFLWQLLVSIRVFVFLFWAQLVTSYLLFIIFAK